LTTLEGKVTELNLDNILNIVDVNVTNQLDDFRSSDNNSNVILNNLITNEAKARSDADTVLQGQINLRATSTDLNSEIKARTDADTLLQGQINLRATSIGLTAEIKARTDADTALQGQIDTRAYSSDLAPLLSKTDAASTYATTTSLTNEAKIRADADTALQGLFSGYVTNPLTNSNDGNGQNIVYLANVGTTRINGRVPMYNPSYIHLDMNSNSIQSAYDVTLHSLTKNPQTTGTDIKVFSSLDLDPNLNASKNIVGVNNIETKTINGGAVVATSITDSGNLTVQGGATLNGGLTTNIINTTGLNVTQINTTTEMGTISTGGLKVIGSSNLDTVTCNSMTVSGVDFKTLQGQITTLNTDLSSEIKTRTTADTALQKLNYNNYIPDV